VAAAGSEDLGLRKKLQVSLEIELAILEGLFESVGHAKSPKGICPRRRLINVNRTIAQKSQ
jgi:hypothetical protein